ARVWLRRKHRHRPKAPARRGRRRSRRSPRRPIGCRRATRPPPRLQKLPPRPKPILRPFQQTRSWPPRRGKPGLRRGRARGGLRAGGRPIAPVGAPRAGRVAVHAHASPVGTTPKQVEVAMSGAAAADVERTRPAAWPAPSRPRRHPTPVIFFLAPLTLVGAL